MSASAVWEGELEASFQSVIETVTRIEEYPEFLPEIQAVQSERPASLLSDLKSEQSFIATYQAQVIKSFEYTLSHHWDPVQYRFEWKLESSGLFKVNEGYWKIIEPKKGEEDSAVTEIYYEIKAQFKIPVPKAIISRLVDGNLPDMMNRFEAQARKRQGLS